MYVISISISMSMSISISISVSVSISISVSVSISISIMLALSHPHMHAGMIFGVQRSFFRFLFFFPFLFWCGGSALHLYNVTCLQGRGGCRPNQRRFGASAL